MVRIRLARAGGKKKPFYRIVAADSRSPRDGRFIEQLGLYDPKADPPVLRVDHERVDYWLGVGATPSATISQFLRKARRASPSQA